MKKKRGNRVIGTKLVLVVDKNGRILKVRKSKLYLLERNRGKYNLKIKKNVRSSYCFFLNSRTTGKKVKGTGPGKTKMILKDNHKTK